MSNTKMTLVDWLDDLCVRFIVNLPNEELQSVERICFQIEEAQWFYEDFIRPLDPNNLPSMHLRKFSQLMFQHCPLFSAYSEELHQRAYDQFLAYKIRVPVRGAIMLNQDMTKAVLVKGWKKGAKWSFPRGKINKEETDLDCAVREVWEETGHDLRAANLVLPDEDMKKITVTMRDQSMMLYVFRGVAEDYPFEPQTRKEISKIDWYKLTDLPTLRRKNQVQQQIPGQDMIKESSFYMVAPFLGPLRAWIKQQQKLDRQRARNSAQHLAPPVGIPITDDEDIQAEYYEPSMVPVPEPLPAPHPDDSFANLVARLSHRPSDALPEVSAQDQTEQSIDPAEELKRLLSVGPQAQPVDTRGISSHGQQPQANPLLALFQQQSNKMASPHHSLPQTPFDQFMSPPVQPQSPHGQHHPRPPQMDNLGPPPPFGFPPQGMPFHGHQQPFNNTMHAQIPPHFMPPPHLPSNTIFPSHQQMANQHVPREFQQSYDGHAAQSQSFQASQSQSFGAHGPGPAIPPASKLPKPNLSAHRLGLLNAFKVGEQQSPVLEPSQAIQSPPIASHVPHQPLQHQPNELASPHFQSPPLNIQPAQPKPRSAHQDSLLTLFRNTPPISSPEPAELSAHPTTPGNVTAQLASKAARGPNPTLLDMFGSQPKPGGITSATVRGPVNAPDFDTMKKNTLPVSGSSRGPSPAFIPQQILRREQSASRSPSNINGGRNKVPLKAEEIVETPQTAFKPQILKRPQQSNTTSPAPAPVPTPTPTAHAKSLLEMFKSPSPQPPAAAAALPTPNAHAKGLLDMFKGPSPQPTAAQSDVPLAQSPAPNAMQQSFDQREAVHSDQKNALLSLFSKPSPKPEGPRKPAPLQQSHSPLPTTRSPLPPTPKSAMSGIVSPVSPLQKGSQGTSPADFASRSRISSIGDAVAPSIVIPPTSHPAATGSSGEDMQGQGTVGGLGGQSRSSNDGKSPVDKAFLLGFLSDVARRGR